MQQLEQAGVFFRSGLTHMNAKHFNDAAACFEAALDLGYPTPREVHHRLSDAMMLAGDMVEGWGHRRIERDLLLIGRDPWAPKIWNGENLAGKRVLVWENARGDFIQYLRYVPRLESEGAKVLVATTRSELFAYLFSSIGHSSLWDLGQESQAWLLLTRPDRDYECQLSDLPLFFGMVDSIGPNVEVDCSGPFHLWKHRLRQISPYGLRIGITWKCAPHHDDQPSPEDVIAARNNAAARSVDVQEFSPIAGVDGVSLISLQTGEAAKEADEAQFSLIKAGDGVIDFMDTAAVIANLDLVITVDTAVAHLAGSMRKPVWVALPYYSDPRWGGIGQTTPWYPTMRLFRQSKRGEWGDVFQLMAEDLKRGHVCRSKS